MIAPANPAAFALECAGALGALAWAIRVPRAFRSGDALGQCARFVRSARAWTSALGIAAALAAVLHVSGGGAGSVLYAHFIALGLLCIAVFLLILWDVHAQRALRLPAAGESVDGAALLASHRLLSALRWTVAATSLPLALAAAVNCGWRLLADS